MWKGDLISCGTNAKTVKGDGSEYLTAILYITPWRSAGINVCSMAEMAGCIDACLNTAGRGQMSSVQKGRARKTQLFAANRDAFMTILVADVASFAAYCGKRDIQPCVRLNGTSDNRFELIPVTYNGKRFRNIMEAFPHVIFYDYTKIANRRNLPANYHLTWSYSAANPRYAAMAADAIANGLNVAVVFRRKANIPTQFLGLPTIDGDRDDMRFLDPKGCVVALYAKGKAKADRSGFVID
jgi:hypothetical protein